MGVLVVGENRLREGRVYPFSASWPGDKLPLTVVCHFLLAVASSSPKCGFHLLTRIVVATSPSLLFIAALSSSLSLRRITSSPLSFCEEYGVFRHWVDAARRVVRGKGQREVEQGRSVDLASKIMYTYWRSKMYAAQPTRMTARGSSGGIRSVWLQTYFRCLIPEISRGGGNGVAALSSKHMVPEDLVIRVFVGVPTGLDWTALTSTSVRLNFETTFRTPTCLVWTRTCAVRCGVKPRRKARADTAS